MYSLCALIVAKLQATAAIREQSAAHIQSMLWLQDTLLTCRFAAHSQLKDFRFACQAKPYVEVIPAQSR